MKLVTSRRSARQPEGMVLASQMIAPECFVLKPLSCEGFSRCRLLAVLLLFALECFQEAQAQSDVRGSSVKTLNTTDSKSSGGTQVETASEVGWTKAALIVRQRFETLDRNQDSSLDLTEFLSVDSQDVASEGVELVPTGKDRSELRRDFLLFDFDFNAKLSFREFSAIPGWVDAPYRGAIPDPFSRLIADAVAAMDESYDRWDQRPEELISAHTFVGNFLGSIIPEGNQFVTGRVIDLADLNLDGKVSRLEARHFLEQQLGVRLRDGRKLRDPTGRVVRFDWFLEIDQDQNGEVDQNEIDAWRVAANDLPEGFRNVDLNQDQRITYEELSDPFSGCFFDPVLWFCQADTNLDSFIDWSEMIVGVDGSRHAIQRAMFHAFDDNQDSRLTLQEYLVSPLGNRNYPWQSTLLDHDGDQKLTFNEFEFGRTDLFQLQRRYYFHRLDSDSDGAISRDEFVFESIQSVDLAVFDPQSQTSRVIVQDPNVIELGGFSLHPDGDSLLVHRVERNRQNETRVVRISLADQHHREVCQGRLPTWAPDGLTFVCERSHRGVGIWLMDPNGLSGKMLSQGRCPSWSPDGTQIAFFNQHGVSLYDCHSEEVRPIFVRDEHRHRSLGDRIVWAPDSRSLAFTGRSPSRGEVFVLGFNDRYERVALERFRLSQRNGDVFAWEEDDRILIQSDAAEPTKSRFSALHLDGELQEGVNEFFAVDEKGASHGKEIVDSSDPSHASSMLSGPNAMLSGRMSRDGRWFFSIFSESVSSD